MDKLYAAIFGVYMGSPKDDLTDFIEIVKSVLSDEKTTTSTNNTGCWGWYWLIIIFFIVLILLLLIYLYLKVVW
ncbi:VACli_082 [Vaccinia virus]|uniref:Protein OPG078 n=1 Tax=Vaccinia virus TaxID=10245 RepID=Q1M2D5_VACCV|nr:VACAC2_082 [Vaccinia virus]UMP62113.1 synVACV_082 [Vector synVACV-wt]UMP62347.1 synVACV_082 [Vector synVACV-SFV]UMP62581.1 synVACV_082 [Vector synVACV-Delta6]UMP62815.1 synVACV_082 [Vector synVACV-Delta5-6]UMP63049.1 synVACV_082 [Vector synVACV-Delta1-3]UMP63283.1 synVACV_082 [Vector synVACV-Delta3-6]UMP63517.1 synVACV_082 [Vector synVACV-Delta1Delta3-6]